MCNDNYYSFNRRQSLVSLKNVLFYRAGVVDRVFARIGASDNLVQYQSTFMTEMLETAFILAQATQQSLVVVDEVGKYTRHLGHDVILPLPRFHFTLPAEATFRTHILCSQVTSTVANLMQLRKHYSTFSNLRCVSNNS